MSADDPDRGSQQPRPSSEEGASTLGGKQFWADVWFYDQWRIQRNVLTGHYRLLDEENRRHTWGTLDRCLATFDENRRQRRLPPMRGKAVIVLHGLMRTRSSMNPLCDYLREKGGYQVFNMGYASTRGTVGDHAESLAQVITSLEGIEQIEFVAHSLGNLVIRHWLHDITDPDTGRLLEPRIHRMVMLGPPNQGAELAERLVPLDVTGQIAGPAARQLAEGWDELEPKLATPAFEFGILAGGQSNRLGRNPLVKGDDDLVVSVDSTRLAGASDFRVLSVWHTTMMADPVVLEYTRQFLEHGYFQSEKTRQPLEPSR